MLAEYVVEDHCMCLDRAYVDKGGARMSPSRRPHGGGKGLLGQEDSEA